MTRRLQLAILAQALEDLLRYDLRRPLTGAELSSQVEEAYDEALVLLANKHPKLFKKLASIPNPQKRAWLKKIERALNE